MRFREAVNAVIGGSATAEDVEKDEKPQDLLPILRDVERHAAGLIKANQQLADQGAGDGRFTAVAGGEEYLASWRRWVEKNLGIRL